MFLALTTYWLNIYRQFSLVASYLLTWSASASGQGRPAKRPCRVESGEQGLENPVGARVHSSRACAPQRLLLGYIFQVLQEFPLLFSSPSPLNFPFPRRLWATYHLRLFFQVKLESHTLHIHDDKDNQDSVVVKIKLSNCVVKDWSDEQRPYVMEIRRTLGRPHYLQAQSESGTHS